MKKKNTFWFIILLVSYAGIVQANKYYISASGNDLNAGSVNLPFKTISQGALVAQAGDTVYVLEGIYRERVAPPRGGSIGKPIVYMGEPNKNVVIKGSDIWKPSWNKLGTTVYYAIPDEAMFNDDCYVDNKNPFKIASSSTPYSRQGKAEVYFGYAGDTTLVYTIGQVFVDGIMYIQKPFIAEMNATAKTWFYDRKTGNLYVHFSDDNPSGHSVEISTRRRIFAPHKRQLTYITVQGFVMEHCGNQYPANFWEVAHPEWQQAGALGTRSGRYWVIKNNMIRFANGVGIDFGNEGNSGVDLETGTNGTASSAGYHIIDSNYICDNGAAGTAAYVPVSITITNNVFERNVNLKFYGNKRWESAAIKMHGAKNSLVAHNLFRNNYGQWTIWFDGGGGPGTRVHGNLIIGGNGVAGLKGFDMEIGVSPADNVLLDNNIMINQDYGISTRNSGGLTALHNLIMESSVMGIDDFIDKTRGGCTSDYQYYYNNVLLNCKGLVDAYPPNIYNVAPYNYTSSDRRFDYNLYQAAASNKKFKLETVDSLYFSGWQTYWRSYNVTANYDLNSKLITTTTYSLNTTALTMQLNVGSDYLAAKTFAYGGLDNDFLGNALKNDGTALPGPFQNLTTGSNQISLWSGLKPLDVYIKPYDTITTDTGNIVKSGNLNIYSNPVDKCIHIAYKSTFGLSNVNVLIYNVLGKMVYNNSYIINNQSTFKTEINTSSFSPELYIVRVFTDKEAYSRKIFVSN
jgi:Right handed beta helix region/Secretion system C-terminal sorting domain